MSEPTDDFTAPKENLIPFRPQEASKDPVIDVDAELLRLADLDKVAYLQERKASAKALDWPVSELDKMISDLRSTGAKKDGPGSDVLFATIEPWPHPVDGAVLLDEIFAQISRFVAADTPQKYAVSVWALFAHAFDAFEISPRLLVTSPEKRCGKSTLLRVINKLVPKPLFAANASPSTMFRLADSEQPTLILDEVDGYVKDSEDHRNLVNAGHAIENCHILRNVGEGANMTPSVFRIWCPMVLAGIGRLQDTIEDRSIILRMRRRKASEQVVKARRKELKEIEYLARKAARWASDNIDALTGLEPFVPQELNDRAGDNWEPLLAIAHVVGGPWPDRIRAAAIVLSCDETADDDATVGVMLLSDAWQIFTDMGVDKLRSKELVAALVELEDRPWPEWRRGNPITPTSISRLLKPYGIAPNQMRFDYGAPGKGYEKSRFQEPYERYVLGEKTHTEPLSPKSKRNTETNGGMVPKTGVSEPKQKGEMFRLGKAEISQQSPVCFGVSAENGESGSVSSISEDLTPSDKWHEDL